MRAVRIIADKLQDCYAALGVVHTKYKPHFYWNTCSFIQH
ncbi:GTP pyrophosphokinase (ATP:GTP 3'-pyrophosphotransferase)(ppGpp synthetase I) ((P)ppGpp synthetase) [Vibrio parahaemolyticus AQ3810]|nr:GTP pyrophosphokinase (ATP:GTP 3'-pyrophosphotransferase)(ppGpp synthetase I) ((P)ppGpp synthetase) [Vibrio parahaemolyticus AQ3810]